MVFFCYTLLINWPLRDSYVCISALRVYVFRGVFSGMRQCRFCLVKVCIVREETIVIEWLIVSIVECSFRKVVNIRTIFMFRFWPQQLSLSKKSFICIYLDIAKTIVVLSNIVAQIVHLQLYLINKNYFCRYDR